jgi:hypothetical protein
MIHKLKHEIANFFKNKFINSYLDTVNKRKIINYKNINIIVIYKNDEDCDLKHIYMVLKRLYNITQYIEKTFNIILLLSPLSKKIKNNILSYINVNSGFTYLNKNDIYIVRKEEYPKVLLHELLHHNKYIHSSFKEYNINRLKKHFNIIANNTFDPNETIVEFWATIIHLKHISEDYNLDFYKLYLDELKYSLYKCYQLYNLPNNLLNTSNTNIYCYIIFKTILLYNLVELQKIYTFPYNDDVITDFLISHSQLPLTITKNPSKNRPDDSLCFMSYSDL